MLFCTADFKLDAVLHKGKNHHPMCVGFLKLLDSSVNWVKWSREGLICTDGDHVDTIILHGYSKLFLLLNRDYV